MAYNRPVCRCGNDLVFVEEFFYREQRRIGPDGKPAERRMKQTEDDKFVQFEKLRCLECLESYEFEYDEFGRIVVIGRVISGYLDSGHNRNILSNN